MEHKIDYGVTVVTFNNEAQRRFSNVPVNDIKMNQAKAAEFVVPSGMTRLFATGVEEIKALQSQFLQLKQAHPQDKVTAVFVLITDGEDNNSGSVTESDLKQAIAAAKQQGIHCFFLGAEQRSTTIGHERYGFDVARCLTLSSDPSTFILGIELSSTATGKAARDEPSAFSPTEQNFLLQLTSKDDAIKKQEQDHKAVVAKAHDDAKAAKLQSNGQIADLNQELAAKDTDIHRLQAALKDKDEALKARNQTLKDKYEALKARDETIRDDQKRKNTLLTSLGESMEKEKSQAMKVKELQDTLRNSRTILETALQAVQKQSAIKDRKMAALEEKLKMLTGVLKSTLQGTHDAEARMMATRSELERALETVSHNSPGGSGSESASFSGFIGSLPSSSSASCSGLTGDNKSRIGAPGLSPSGGGGKGFNLPPSPSPFGDNNRARFARNSPIGFGGGHSSGFGSSSTNNSSSSNSSSFGGGHNLSFGSSSSTNNSNSSAFGGGHAPGFGYSSSTNNSTNDSSTNNSSTNSSTNSSSSGGTGSSGGNYTSLFGSPGGGRGGSGFGGWGSN